MAVEYATVILADTTAPQDGDTVVFDGGLGRWVLTPAGGGGTSSSAVHVGPTDPAPDITPGTEYVWFKTDGDGVTLDIITGKA